MVENILTPLDFARTYCEEGWKIFPLHGIKTGTNLCTCGDPLCKSPGKHPKTQNGVKDATDDIAVITSWFAGAQDTNIGIATGEKSGLVVVDLDSGKGGDAKKLAADVEPTAFSTLRVQTGQGSHFYYRYPKGASVRNSAGKLGPHVDVRGDGGYVVAPPSKHVSGRQYTFLDSEAELLEMPEAWLKKLSSSQPTPQQHTASSPNGNGSGNGHGHPANSGERSFVVPPPDPGLRVPQLIDFGSRNNTLIKLAGLLRHHGFAEDAIYSALRSENNRICKPPLDDKEVHDIAHSAGRYAPKNVLSPVGEDDDTRPDYENTLKPYLYKEFKREKFEAKEILGFHIGKRDIAIVQAATNAGKTTLLRNIGLCMAAGRPFMPFYEGSRAVKIAYFDFENDAQDVQRDLGLMDTVFTDAEQKLIGKNLIVIPKGLMGGELFQFNTHEKWANELIRDNGVEFIIVDNISAAYDLNDENSNAEVTRKVIKPLLKMAYKCDCAFLFAHHYGKGKPSEIEAAGVHAGRGASALQALSRTVINMFGDVSAGLPVIVECAKRKTDGGQTYREQFKLEPDRWFHHSKLVAPPKKPTAYVAVRKFVEKFVYPSKVTTKKVIEQFENDYGPDMVKKALNELYKDGFIERVKHGEYRAKTEDDDE